MSLYFTSNGMLRIIPKIRIITLTKMIMNLAMNLFHFYVRAHTVTSLNGHCFVENFPLYRSPMKTTANKIKKMIPTTTIAIISPCCSGSFSLFFIATTSVSVSFWVAGVEEFLLGEESSEPAIRFKCDKYLRIQEGFHSKIAIAINS